jgi:hypothetical protein
LDSRIGLVDKIAQSTKWTTECASFEELRETEHLGHSKPMLLMKNVSNVNELRDFFEYLSKHVYYCMKDMESLDIHMIESAVLNDFIDL